MEDLTTKQEIVFDAIKSYIHDYGYSPTIRELCTITGRRSPGTIHAELKILKRKGYIDYIYNRNRTIRVINERIG